MTHMTEEEIKDLQNWKADFAEPGIDWYGSALKVDGDYGPKTQWFHELTLQVEPLQQTVRNFLALYQVWGQGNISVETAGANRGKLPDRCMLPAGEKFLGKPWCIGLQSLVIREAKCDWPIHHVSAAEMLKWAAAEKRITMSPKPGYAYGFLYPPGRGFEPGSGHGGIYLGGNAEWAVVGDGNVKDRIRVGMRRRQGLTFVRTVLDTTGDLLPAGLDRLDGWKDR